MRLTDIQIKRIKPSAKPYKVSDGGGLFLWITPSGGKIWRWDLQTRGPGQADDPWKVSRCATGVGEGASR